MRSQSASTSPTYWAPWCSPTAHAVNHLRYVIQATRSSKLYSGLQLLYILCILYKTARSNLPVRTQELQFSKVHLRCSLWYQWTGHTVRHSHDINEVYSTVYHNWLVWALKQKQKNEHHQVIHSSKLVPIFFRQIQLNSVFVKTAYQKKLTAAHGTTGPVQKPGPVTVFYLHCFG